MNVRKKLGVIALVVMLAVCFCTMAYADDVVKLANPQSNVITIPVNVSSASGFTGPRPATSISFTAGTVSRVEGHYGTVALESVPSVTVGSSPVAFGIQTAGAATNGGSFTVTVDGLTEGDYNEYKCTITPTIAAPSTGLADAAGTATYELHFAVNNGAVDEAVLVRTVDSNPIKVANISYEYSTTIPAAVTFEKVFAGSAAVAENFAFEITVSTDASWAGLGFTIDNNGSAIASLPAATLTANNDNTAAVWTYTGGIKANVSREAVDDTTGPDETLYQAAVDASNLVFSGLPAGATITFQETSLGQATKVYSYTKSGDNDFGPGSLTGVATDSGTTITVGADAQALRYINVLNLSEISLTGVSLRYAPYLLTLGAGIVALPLTKTYRRREDF